MYSPGLKNSHKGDHIFALINKKDQVMQAIDFLRVGFDLNERVVYMTDSVSKNELRDLIKKEWKIKNLENLESQKHIVLVTTQELAESEGVGSRTSTENVWKKLTMQALEDGKSGLRVFTDTSGFFKNHKSEQVIGFESSLEKEFDFPCIVVCAYYKDDFMSLKDSQKEILLDHHNKYWS